MPFYSGSRLKLRNDIHALLLIEPASVRPSSPAPSKAARGAARGPARAPCHGRGVDAPCHGRGVDARPPRLLKIPMIQVNDRSRARRRPQLKATAREARGWDPNGPETGVCVCFTVHGAGWDTWDLI
jgi:hypothetical protein